MTFETSMLVRFGDVDAAGIVFYPRYFEMLNCAVEDWSAQVLECSYHEMQLVRRFGIPVVAVSAAFAAPSILGDALSFTVAPQTIGKSSSRIEVNASCLGEHRVRFDMTIVCMDLDKRRSMPWPADIAERIRRDLDTASLC